MPSSFHITLDYWLTQLNRYTFPGKEDIYKELLRQKEEITILAHQINSATFKGKTKHPGLEYFDANEWFQFAEMHLRHHMRQKARLDEFLKS